MDLLNWGRSTTNIINECLNYGLPSPTFEYEWTAVKTTFYLNKKTAQKTAQKNIDIKGATKNKIVNLLRENPKYTKQDIMVILNKADGTIKEYLSSQKMGLIERVGGRKLGYWKVNDEM